MVVVRRDAQIWHGAAVFRQVTARGFCNLRASRRAPGAFQALVQYMRRDQVIICHGVARVVGFPSEVVPGASQFDRCRVRAVTEDEDLPTAWDSQAAVEAEVHETISPLPLPLASSTRFSHHQ